MGRYPAGASATHGAVGLDPSRGEATSGVVTRGLGRYPVGAATTHEEVVTGKNTIRQKVNKRMQRRNNVSVVGVAIGVAGAWRRNK